LHASELTTGRTFGIRLDPGESFFPALEEFCHANGIRYGYIPMFLAAFADADIVGTCDRLDDPAAPAEIPRTPARVRRPMDVHQRRRAHRRGHPQLPRGA
jgi:hypothetical protein